MRTGQIIQFPLGKGLAGDANPKSKPIASLKSGVNIRWPKDGTIGKRWGAAPIALPNGTAAMSAFQDGQRFIPRGETLSITDGNRIATYDPVAANWLRGSKVSEVALEWSTLVDDLTGVASSDIDIVGDLLIHAWVTGDPTRRPEYIPAADIGGVCWVEVKNYATGEYLKKPIQLASSNARHVRVIASGTRAFVFYSASATVVCVVVNLSSIAPDVAQTLASDVANTANSKGRFDVAKLASGDYALVYEKDSAGLKIAAKRFTVSGGTLSSAVSADIGTDTVVQALSICEDATASRLYVFYSHLTSGTQWDIAAEHYRMRILAVSNTALTSALAATTVETEFIGTQCSIKLVSTGHLAAAWSGIDQAATLSVVPLASTRVPSLRSAKLDNTGAKESGTYSRSAGLELLSEVFAATVRGTVRYYVFACDARYGGVFIYDQPDANTTLQTPSVSTYLVELDMAAAEGTNAPHRYVGKIDHDIGGVFQTGRVAQVPDVDTETFYAVLPYQATANPVSFNWRCGLRLVRMTADLDLISDPWRSVVVAGEAYIAGSHVQAWDGRTVFDYGMRAPYVVDAGNIWTGDDANGLMANGTYLYKTTAGYRSRAGVLHRGPFSIAVAVPVTSPNSNGSIYGAITTASIDSKQSAEVGFGANSAGVAFFDLYRSEANGSFYYKLTYEPRHNTLRNDPTTQILEFHDKRNDDDITDPDTSESPGASGAIIVPDVALSTRPAPYIDGGELEDCQPPAAYSVHFQGGRIFIITGDRRTVWYSKDMKENPGVAPGFSPDQVEIYEHDLVAFAALDDKRIVFWERGLWFVSGDGPTVDGLNNRFTPPNPIQSDAGCTNPRSVLSWPGGVVFQSGTDLYNLGRDLNVTWFGKSAREILEAYPTITSAVLVAAESELRFTCNSDEEGIVLVFDYERGTWSTRTYENASGTIQDATLHLGTYYLLSDGVVLTEDTTTHLDTVASVDTFVPSTVELESIAPSGPVGWQRVRVARMLGQSLSNHSLTIAASRDWSDTYEQTKTFAAGSAVTTPSTHERAEVALTIQRRQAVGLRFTDAAPANTTLYPLGNGAGFQLEGVGLIVQPKPGGPRDTSTRRGG